MLEGSSVQLHNRGSLDDEVSRSLASWWLNQKIALPTLDALAFAPVVLLGPQSTLFLSGEGSPSPAQENESI